MTITDARGLLRPLAFTVLSLVLPAAVAAGTEPDPFTIAPRRDVLPLAEVVSAPFTLYGLDQDSSIQVSAGSISINGGAFAGTAGIVRNGDVVRIKTLAPAAYGASSTIAVTVGSVSRTFVVSAVGRRATPDLFRLPPVLAAEPGSSQVSAAVIVSGINTAVPVAVTGGLYSINGGGWTAEPGQVVNGDAVRVSADAAVAPETVRTATLSIGGRSAVFAVVSDGVDTVPNPFQFSGPVSGLPALAQTSSVITVSGINAPTPITSPDGTPFQINGGPFSALPGVVMAGDKVALYVTASTRRGELRSGAVSIGGVNASFFVQSDAAVDQVPDAFAVRAVTAQPGTEVISSPVLVANVNTLTPVKVSGAEYSINGGPYSAQEGQVLSGDTVTMKMLAAATSGQSKSATLTIGNGAGRTRSATWKVTSKTLSSPLSFKLSNADIYAGATVFPGTIVTTLPVTVSNARKPVAVKVSGGFYSINGGRYVATDGTAFNGDVVTVQAKAPSGYSQTGTVKLSLGSQSSSLTITTSADPVAATRSAFDGVTTHIYRVLSPEPLRVFVAFPPGWQAQDRRAARVQFFAGGYNHGDPESAVGAARSWARRSGYVGFAPDFRVNDRFGSSPAVLADDNRLVVKWIMDNAAMFGVDPTRVVVAGGSSGGGSAFFAAMPNPPATTDPAHSPPFPVAAVSIRGGAVEVAEGDGSYALPKPNYFFPVSNAISPARNLVVGMPPVIMVHGDADDQVPQSTVIAACNQIRSFGTRCQFRSASGSRHILSKSVTDRADDDDEAFMTSLGILPSLR